MAGRRIKRWIVMQVNDSDDIEDAVLAVMANEEQAKEAALFHERAPNIGGYSFHAVEASISYEIT